MNDIILEMQDMRYVDWNLRKMSPGTPGCFLKSYEEVHGKRLYYKLSNYDSYRGVFGHECVNELIVSRVMDVLGIRHVDSTWSMKWVQSRIVPSSRQNIGQILRANGMESYDEYKLLLKSQGRSCQDEFYIESL